LRKAKKEVVVSFADSTSIEQVTGSCVRVENILLELGGSQGGGSMLDNYRHNNSNFSFKVKDIDYIFLMHSHIDHIMRVPLYYKRNGEAKTFIPSGNREIMYLQLMNCALILRGEAESLSKDSPVEPIFTESDVERMFEHVYEVDFNIKRNLDDNISFEFISSGHVPFASSLLLEINDKKIYYTSDIGNGMFGSYYVEPQEIYNGGVDLVISECTYSDKKRSCKKQDEREKDIQRITSVVDQYTKILFPSFAFARSQQILTMLYDIYKDDPTFEHEIVLDSILLNDITNIYKKRFPKFREVLAWNKVRQITKKDRMALMQDKNTKLIVISASGSLTGGASIAWTKSFLPNPKACCVIIGHTFEGTLGRTIKDGNKKYIKIGEDEVKNNMQVVSLKSMSSHIQYNELIDFLTDKVSTPKIILHHSSQSDKLLFKKDLEKVFEEKMKSVKVICPDKKTKIKI
jgi:metallo-beta-lactamase family protein